MNKPAEAIAETSATTDADNGNSESMQQENPSRALPDWVQKIAEPIVGGAGGAGEDPRYSDRFSAIKTEIDKLSGADFKVVIDSSRELLQQEGKDLRVAGYLLMGTLFTEGLKGMADALESYSSIIENFWDNCFPARESGRLQSYAWLNNDRMSSYIRQIKSGALDLEELEALNASLERLHKLANQKLGDEANRWKSLGDWTTKALTEKKAAQAKLAKDQQAQEERLSQAASIDGAITDGKAGELISKLASHFRDQGELSRAIGVLRVYRWGNLKTPPNENGTTRIPPLRPTALTELQLLQTNSAAPVEIFNRSEASLMEPGGQWNMDLQLIAFHALKAMKAEEAAQMLENEVFGLLKRCPDLQDLCYDGGTSFAGADAREWLEEIGSSREGGGGPEIGAVHTDEIKSIIKASHKEAKSGSLLEGINILKDLPDDSGRERFVKRLEEARLCAKAKEPEMAMTILEDIDKNIENRELAQWEPALAIDTWRLLSSAIKQVLPKADVSQKPQLEKKLKEIHAAVCKIDLQEAVRMTSLKKAKGV